MKCQIYISMILAVAVVAGATGQDKRTTASGFDFLMAKAWMDESRES